MLITTVLLCVFLNTLPTSGRSADEADPATTTPNHCRCKSTCGATVEDKFKQDWCYTKDSCGEYSVGYGYWDHCEYLDSEKPDYLAMTWRQKQDKLWEMIAADDTKGKYYTSELMTESVLTPFEDEWDVMPNGRHKGIHSVGAICPFEIKISDDSPYTGLLKAGSTVEGIARLGSAGDPFASGEGKDLVPGVGIKFLRTGVHSANFMLLHSLNPLPENNFNFFAKSISNHISGKL